MAKLGRDSGPPENSYLDWCKRRDFKANSTNWGFQFKMSKDPYRGSAFRVSSMSWVNFDSNCSVLFH